jgi:dTDP-4-dehydrorhamnose reductase
MKILVTGANGQLGFCLQKLLAATQFEFKALGRNELDISDTSAVERLVAEYKPNIIINAAAYTAVDKAESESENAFRINRDGAANLAITSKKIDAAIFHISSDYVFAGDKETPYSEEDVADPQSVYGKSKLEGEQAVIQQNDKHIVLRTAWVFGEQGNNFVKTMIRLGKTRDQLGVVADQHGGPTYAGDIAKALVKMAEIYQQQANLDWGVYHYAGEPHVTWHQFAENIFDQADAANLLPKGKPLVRAITSADYPTLATRPKNSRLDCQKISQAFSLQPSDWQAALTDISAYNS